jgi:hypothetical protein
VSEAERLERVRLESVVAPRGLSLEQQSAISDELRSFSGRTVVLVSYGRDPEGSGIATQIIAASRAARLNIVDSRFSIVRLGGFDLGMHVNGPVESQDMVLALGNALSRPLGAVNIFVNAPLLQGGTSMQGAAVSAGGATSLTPRGPTPTCPRQARGSLSPVAKPAEWAIQ